MFSEAARKSFSAVMQCRDSGEGPPLRSAMILSKWVLRSWSRRQLTQDLADRQWQARRFRDIAADRHKGRTGRLEPERIAAAFGRKQHHRNALQIVIEVGGIAAHVAQRIVARGATVLVERIEQMDLLPMGSREIPQSDPSSPS